MSQAGFFGPLALAAVLAWALSWLIPAKPQRPHLFRTSLVLGIPWLAGHLTANGLNFFYPPATGVDWLIFATAVWMTLSGLAALHSPSVVWRHREAALVAGTLLLAAGTFYPGQSGLTWLFHKDETPGTRSALAWAITAGGAGFAGSWILLARLLPAWGFHLCAAVLSITLACTVSAHLGPLWIAAVQALPAAIALGAGTGSLRQGTAGRVTLPAAGWTGAMLGLPFLWACISRSPVGPWQVLVLLALLPLVIFILLKPLAARLHPAGLTLMAAGLLLLGGTALLHFSGLPSEEPLVNRTGDDSGAYD
ncbi:MAG: hypothetical protein V4726_09335 [Verrucomicrobiota bacterium]